jgi:C4-dicarboxylate-specific signal transduction histidine kinase
MEFHMVAKLERSTESGLQFFGKMTSSISHEIKNVLAIVNENAGLLGDLALMADRGTAIQPQRLMDMSRTVMKQVRRADAIVKNMNRLAHSVDESTQAIELNDILEMLVALSEQFASMRDVAVRLKRNENPVKLRTSAFFLLNLLWLCLDFAMDAANKDKIVELVTQKSDTDIQICFRGLDGLAGPPVREFPAEPEKDLCDLLGAGLNINSANREIVVKLSGGIDGN